MLSKLRRHPVVAAALLMVALLVVAVPLALTGGDSSGRDGTFSYSDLREAMQAGEIERATLKPEAFEAAVVWRAARSTTSPTRPRTRRSRSGWPRPART